MTCFFITINLGMIFSSESMPCNAFCCQTSHKCNWVRVNPKLKIVPDKRPVHFRVDRGRAEIQRTMQFHSALWSILVSFSSLLWFLRSTTSSALIKQRHFPQEWRPEQRLNKWMSDLQKQDSKERSCFLQHIRRVNEFLNQYKLYKVEKYDTAVFLACLAAV